MKFEFACTVCRHYTVVDGPIGQVPATPRHHKRLMRRIYNAEPAIIQWGISDYVEKAVRGEEKVPGMTQQEVKQLVDTSFTKQS